MDKIKTIIEDIRLNTPQETKQAKAIVDSRNSILDEAKKEADEIIAQAQAQARELVARDQITQTAQAEAADIMAKAKEEGEAYIQDAKIRLPRFSAMLLPRQTICLQMPRTRAGKCLQL